MHKAKGPFVCKLWKDIIFLNHELSHEIKDRMGRNIFTACLSGDE